MARDLRKAIAGRREKPPPLRFPIPGIKPPRPPVKRVYGLIPTLPNRPPPRRVPAAAKPQPKMVAAKRAPIKAPVKATTGTASTLPRHAFTPAQKSRSLTDRTPAAKARVQTPRPTRRVTTPAQLFDAPPELTDQQLVQQQLDPLYLENDQALQQEQQFEQQRTAMIRAMTGELMGKLGQLAPAVSADYQGFFDRNLAAAREGSQALAAATTDPQIKADLAAVGAPAEQVQQLGDLTQNIFQGGGAVLQNQQGTVPGAAIAATGAAETAYARKLPAIAGLQGAEDLASFLTEAGRTRQQLANERAQIAAKAPGLLQDILSSRATQAAKERALQLEEYALGLRSQNQRFQQGVTKTRLGFEKVKLTQAQKRLQMSALQADRTWQATLQRLGISTAAEKRKAAEFELKARQGGYTPSQLAKMKGTSYTIADHAFHGFTETNSKGETVATHRPLSYGEAIREMLKEGIPLRLATPALNFYYRPNQRGPVSSLLGAAAAITNP